MNKEIPLYFEATVVDSSLQDIITTPTTNVSRMKVRAFTRYGNRNGSYITNEVAEQLIQSATNGDTPVIGFFDPSSGTWASHTGPTLANGYGYVESFLGWEPFMDTDGVEREYAVFSVVLFTKYYEEANKIFGQNQSMELDPNSIDGQWTEIDGKEYFIYSAAKILGFCVIGSHEPCFSVSAFFAKKDDNTNLEFSSLLSELKTFVEGTENLDGGEPKMDDNLSTAEVVENENTQVEPEVVEQPVAEFEAAEEPVQETEPAQETEFAAEPESESEVVPAVEEEDNRLNDLQNEFEDLQSRMNELQAQYDTLLENYNNLESIKNTLEQNNAALQESINNYQAQVAAAELVRKNELIDKYEKKLAEEEIVEIRAQVNDFTYEDLESKLAVKFASRYLNEEENVSTIPVLNPQQSQFALLMNKYRKN